MMDPTQIAKRVQQKTNDYSLAKKQLASINEQLVEAKEQEEITATVQAIIQQLAQSIQTQVHSKISAIVSRCLKSVFEEYAYEFQVEFEMKRGKTEAKLSFLREGLLVDPLTAAGGGVVDVASFALRLAALLLTKPRRRLLLVLDEPFRFVSARYRPRIANLLEQLSEELDFQLIMVTHDPTLCLGKVVEL